MEEVGVVVVEIVEDVVASLEEGITMEEEESQSQSLLVMTTMAIISW